MSEGQSEVPFKQLGERLKTIRQKLHESVAEVSGAVEIEERDLTRIEQGQERPSEDILLLLINHFGIQDDDAASLWTMAGYDQPDDDRPHNDSTPNSRTMVMIMAVDPRIIYSDGVQINANQHGVTLNFSQGVGTPQQMVTSRIGMSREHAQDLLQALHRVLEGSKPKQLPAGPSAPSSQDVKAAKTRRSRSSRQPGRQQDEQ